MAISRALRRLLQIREIEEEQSELALASALSEFMGLEQLLDLAGKRERSGRQLVVRGAQNGELPDRLAGLEESRSAMRCAEVVETRITYAEALVAERRQTYFAKRVERRQAEMLIHETEIRDAVDSARRSQQGLDNWYLNRLHAKRCVAEDEPENAPQLTVRESADKT